jgi:hypothetical protein
MALVTVDDAKLDLNILNDDRDDAIERAVNKASHIVLNYLKLPDTEWQDTNGEPNDVPYTVQAATSLAAGALLANPEGHPDGPQALSQAVKDLLHRYRDPALA